MNQHPAYYTSLLQRRFSDDNALTPVERREMDLHLLICPKCNYDYAWLLMAQAPETALMLLLDIEGELTPEQVTPYLRDLAQTFQADLPLTGFQSMLWRFISRDPEALGQFRLIEADVWLHGD